MKETGKSSQADSFDIQAYEDLMELVFSYSAAARDFGFTHKLSNRFTALSMNATFLKQALAHQDYDKAGAKALQISESINNLVKFSQDLMSTDQVAVESQELEFPTMIAETLGHLLGLPTFRTTELEQHLSTEAIRTRINPGIIWIFLYTYLKNAKRYKIQGPIHLSSTIDKERGQYIIKTDVDQILSAPDEGTEESDLAFPSAGEIPIRYLARVIHNVSTRVELIHRVDRPLSVELMINLSPQK